MKIAILGFGNVGKRLAALWQKAGFDVIAGVRSPNGTAEGDTIPQQSFSAAVTGADVVVVALPWEAVQPVLLDLSSSLANAVLIDATNPLTSDLKLLPIQAGSAAALIASLLPGVRIIKAFNTLGAGLLGNADYEGARASGFYCGDDEAAKTVAVPLIEAAGLDPVDVGPLENASHLESMAALWIDLTVHKRLNGSFAFRLLRRPE